MESGPKFDFTTELPQELVGCICSHMDSSTLLAALSVSKKLNTVGNKYIDQNPRLTTNIDHIYALVIGLEKSGKSCLTTILAGAGDYTRNATHTTTTSLYMPPLKAITLLNPPGGKRNITKVWRHALACDLPLLVVDTKELTQKDEDDLKELVASTCHLINASNHVIVAVNMLDNIPPNQHLEVFERVKQRVTKLLREIGLNSNQCEFAPVHALTGANTLSSLSKFSWYSGPSLSDLFVKYRQSAKTDPEAYELLSNASLKFQIYERHYIPGIGAVFLGRVLSGTMRSNKTYNIAMVQPFKSMNVRLNSMESRHLMVDVATPGFVIACNLSSFGRRDLHRFKGYATNEWLQSAPTKFHKTVAFRAELSIFAPQHFGANRYYTMYYSGTKFICFVWHVFEEENQSRKIKPNIENTANVNENISKWKAATSGIERPKKKLLNKATAIIVMREEFPLKIATNSPFEKNYDGKIVLVCGKSFVASGKIKKTVDEPANPLTLHKLHFTREVHDNLMSRFHEFFKLPQEREQCDKLIALELTNPRARRVFCTEEEFLAEKRKRINKKL